MDEYYVYEISEIYDVFDSGMVVCCSLLMVVIMIVGFYMERLCFREY